jgi:hypothetical protein
MKPLRHIDPTADRTVQVRILLAAFSIAAGVIHAAVVPEHLEETWVFALFFIVAAGFQIAWTIPVVFGPSSGVYAAGAVANGAMIGIWSVSRTIGLPIGPERWMTESAGLLDITATALELLLVAGSLVLRARLHADRDTTQLFKRLVATVEPRTATGPNQPQVRGRRTGARRRAGR